MILNLKRYLSLLLVLMFLIGINPMAFAAEQDRDDVLPKSNISEAMETAAETEPEESAESKGPLEIPDSKALAGDASILLSATDDHGIMTAATTTGSITLVNYADNGNYTSSLNSQITVNYKWNGSGETRTCYLKNFGWHYAKYDGVSYADDPLYCIEPHRDYAASTPGNSVDRDVPLDGSGSTSGSDVWFSLNADRRAAIGLILLYTDELWDHSISVTTTSKADNPNVPLRMAAQFLIFEIICGLRDAETFVRNASNECGTSGDIFYNAGTDAISNFSSNYTRLVSEVRAAKEIPSFTSRSSNTAPTITLDGEETSVTDSNGVLGDFNFTDKGGVEFEKAGNTLHITQTGTVSESIVHTATKSIPSAKNSSYSIYYMTGSTFQTTIALYRPKTEDLVAYFKLKVSDACSLNIKKVTEDGKNLSGWQFSIYSDPACTELLSGPHTTDANGSISISGLTPGTVYVKELGHTDSTIEKQYVCTSENPQKVTISKGETATVTFINQRRGQAQIIKTTTNGGTVAGWHFEVKNAEGIVIGEYVTDSTGVITVDLEPGTYTVTETDDEKQYWENDPNLTKTVTVKAGETTEVIFKNQYKGEAQIIKVTTNGGTLAGWHFEVKNSGGKVVGTYETDKTGVIVVDLEPGTYTVTETDAAKEYWENDTVPSRTVTVKAGETAKVTFTNRWMGKGKIVKTATNGGTVEGWTFTITNSAGTFAGKYTTDAKGQIVADLEPGTYTVQESVLDSPYWICDTETKILTVKAGETASVSFRNQYIGRAKIVKVLENPEAGSVEGWKFQVKASNGSEIGTYTTDAEGTILCDLEPGEYTVTELLEADSIWQCVSGETQTVKVKAGETAEVSFRNALKPAEISVHKVDTLGAKLKGAQFLLEWSNDNGKTWKPVTKTDAAYPQVGGCTTSGLKDGKLTTGVDGTVKFTGLYPTLQYRLTETKAPKNHHLLTEPAYEGLISAEDSLIVELTVVNAPIFTLPMTGAVGSNVVRYLQIAGACVLLAMLFRYAKKRR